MGNRNSKFKLFLTILLVIIFLYLSLGLNVFSRNTLERIFNLAKYERRFGIFFTALTSILMVFFVPISWFSALGALFFGLKGFIYVITSGLIAATLAFYIAKIFRPNVFHIINKLYNRKARELSLEEVSREIETHGRGYVFLIRSMPFIPFSVANYLAGLSSINFKDYIIGTILGLGLGQFATMYFVIKAVDIKNNPLGIFLGACVKLSYVFLVLIWQRKSKYNVKD